jgi:hypothetical protein
MANMTDLSARYGNTRPRDHLVAWIVGVSAVVAFVGWVFWVNATDRSAGIEWVAFESTGGESVASVTWNVTTVTPQPITCALRTVGPDMATNGWLVVKLPETQQHTATYTREVRAVGEATGIDVYACWRTNP